MTFRGGRVRSIPGRPPFSHARLPLKRTLIGDNSDNEYSSRSFAVFSVGRFISTRGWFRPDGDMTGSERLNVSAAATTGDICLSGALNVSKDSVNKSNPSAPLSFSIAVAATFDDFFEIENNAC